VSPCRDYKYVGHADSASECLAGARKENATYALFNEKSARVPGAYNCNGIYNFKGGCVMPVRLQLAELSVRRN
jgi:hypothetical protein